MPENNTSELQYELEENYEPLTIADKADGSGTTWPELVSELNRMNRQIAALTQNSGSWDSQFQVVKFTVLSPAVTGGMAQAIIIPVEEIQGYAPLAIAGWSTGSRDLIPYRVRLVDSNANINIGLRAMKTLAAGDSTIEVDVVYAISI